MTNVTVTVRIVNEEGQETSPGRIPPPQSILNAVPANHFVLVVLDARGTNAIFSRKAGQGDESQAQLFIGRNLDTRLPTLSVRKVALDLLTGAKMRAEPLEKDKEVRIFNILEDHLQHAPQGVTPRYARLTSRRDAILPHRSQAKPQYWARLTWWDYYNGGTLKRMISRYNKQARVVPKWLAARCAHQILQTLHFMYTVCRPPIMHGDFNANNILLHYPTPNSPPDFYVIDFGKLSGIGGEGYQKFPAEDPYCPENMGPWDFAIFANVIFKDLISKEDAKNEDTPLGAFYADLQAQKKAYFSSPEMPNLMPFIKTARDLEASFMAEETSLQVLGEDQTTLLPAVFSSREEAANASLCGPFQIWRKLATENNFDNTDTTQYFGDFERHPNAY